MHRFKLYLVIHVLFATFSSDVLFANDNETKVVDSKTAGKRLLCLRAFTRRAEFEGLMDKIAKEAADALEKAKTEYGTKNTELIKWLKDEQLWDALSANEKALIEKPLGTWKEQDRISASWRFEALYVLGWALQLTDSIPAYDTMVETDDFKEKLPFLQKTGDFLAKAALRKDGEIRKARDVAELWHWRARTTELMKDPKKHPIPKELIDAGFESYEKIVVITSEHAAKDGLFKPIDKDFPAFGKAYAKATDAQWSTLRSIASERQYALNWLCGYAEDWDKVPTDT